MPTIVDFVFDDRITMINKLPLSVEPNQTKMTARTAEQQNTLCDYVNY